MRAREAPPTRSGPGAPSVGTDIRGAALEQAQAAAHVDADAKRLWQSAVARANVIADREGVSAWVRKGLVHATYRTADTLSMVERVATLARVKRSADIAYGEGQRRRLDVYHRAGACRAPVMVFFYGGAWKTGRKEMVAFMGYALAALGFVVAIPDTRLYPEVAFPGFIEDGAQATRWLLQNAAQFGGDPEALVMAGHSAGAHTAFMLALDPSYLEAAGVAAAPIRGLIGMAGPYDFYPFPLKLCEEVFGSAPDPHATQPIRFVKADGAPILLIAGERDIYVPFENSASMAREIARVGGQCEFLIEPHIGHLGSLLSFSSMRPVRSEARSRVKQFCQGLPGVDLALASKPTRGESGHP